MTMASLLVVLVATLAIVPDGSGIAVAAASSSSMAIDESTHSASSSSASSSSLTSSEWLKQQQHDDDASAAGQAPHHRQTRFLQLQDETTGEEQDGSTAAASSSTICTTCSFPEEYTFRLAFDKNENCDTSTLEGTESYLFSGVECLMTSSETPPSYISSIHFLEFDSTAYLNVIHENTTYLNGTFYNDEIFTFPSSIALAEGDEYTLPGAAGLFIFGNDEDSGEPILKNQIVWTFGTPEVGGSKDCKKATKELEGKSLGWVVFEKVESTDHEFCIEVSTSSPSSPSSMSYTVTAGSASSSSPTPEPAAATSNFSLLSTNTPTTINNDSSSSHIGTEVGGSKASKSVSKSKPTSSKQSSTGSSSFSKTAKSGEGGDAGKFDGQTTRKGGTTGH